MKIKIIVAVVAAFLLVRFPVCAEEIKLIPPYHWTYHSLASLHDAGLIDVDITPGKSALTPEQAVSLIVTAVKGAEKDMSKLSETELSTLRQLANAYKATFKAAGFEYPVIKNDIEILALRAGFVVDDSSSFSHEEKMLSAKAADSVNRFAFDMFGKLSKKEKDKNFFFSPYSISSAFAMVYAGADGATEDEIAEVFHFEPDIHKSMNILMREASSVPREAALFSVANALWAAKNYKLMPEFVHTVRKDYKAGLAVLNYAADTEGARRVINRWTDTHTNGGIKEIIARGVLTKATKLVLTNAVYFKSSWEREFEPYNTNLAQFKRTNGETLNVRMMKQTFNGLGYVNAGYAEVAELPYKGGRFSMFVVLPSQKSDIAELEDKLNAEEFSSLCEKMEARNVTVSLPKFRQECSYELSQIISEMGAHSPFSAKEANFTGMTGGNKIYIGNVLHKTFIGVAEEGTEAAAATSVIINRISARYDREKYIIFNVNRPFIYIIRENATGAIMFMGKCEKP
ncbi:MAG: serpin family protein [Synergistes sp.]|nr:serpin family protein [Synergistes sp.]